MKKIILSAASLAVAAVASVSVAPTTSEAVPAFARQTGAACLNCHFQTIPRLAAMGREFRMNAFRDTSQDLLEDDHLSLPAFFNASLLTKARISSGSGDLPKGGAVGTADTGVQWPDESALLFGGRISEHAGGFQEWDVISGEMLGGKFAYVMDLDSGIIGIAVGTTDALGAPSIFNDPSNAISRNLRGVQTRAQALRGGVLHGGATGLGVYGYMADSIYFAAGLITPAGGYAAGNGGVEMMDSPYLRAAYLADIAGFDTIIGVTYASVTPVNPVATNQTNAKADVQAVVDVQMQGEVGDMSIGFYMPIIVGGVGATNYTGAMPYVNIGLSHAAGVRLGYDFATSDDANTGDFSNVILGGWYDLAQNVVLDLEINVKDTAAKGTSKAVAGTETTLMLEYVF